MPTTKKRGSSVARRDLNERVVEPQSLGRREVDAVLGGIRATLARIELELHPDLRVP